VLASGDVASDAAGLLGGAVEMATEASGWGARVPPHPLATDAGIQEGGAPAPVLGLTVPGDCILNSIILWRRAGS